MNPLQSTVVSVDNEPAPRLIVESPLPGPLAQGVVFIPYSVENLRILPVGGPAACTLSPRVGHLHITVDDLPWAWADYGQSNTIILVGMPRGPHTVLIEAVDPEGKVFTKQTVMFESPGKPVHPGGRHKSSFSLGRGRDNSRRALGMIGFADARTSEMPQATRFLRSGDLARGRGRRAHHQS